MLNFQLTKDTGKTLVFDVECLGVYLGQIKWYASWRKYCFFPAVQTIFDDKCLQEVITKTKELMEARKIA